MTCCTACEHGGPCVTFATRDEQAAEHARIILEDAASYGVRTLARAIAAELGPDPQGYAAAEAAAVWAFLRARVRYVAEHGEVWTRTLDLLELGAGDCDDLAGAAAALLAALGHRVALAYGSGHVWVVVETPDGDVRHVDATLDRPPWQGAPVVPETVYVLEGTGAQDHGRLATGALAIELVPRDELAKTVKLAAESGTWDDDAQAAALEIWRRCKEGAGDMSAAEWCGSFHAKHGCDTMKATLAALAFLDLDVGELGSVAATFCGWSEATAAAEAASADNSYGVHPYSSAAEWRQLAEDSGTPVPILAQFCGAGIPGACGALVDYVSEHPEYHAVIPVDLWAYAKGTAELAPGLHAPFAPATAGDAGAGGGVGSVLGGSPAAQAVAAGAGLGVLWLILSALG